MNDPNHFITFGYNSFVILHLHHAVRHTFFANDENIIFSGCDAKRADVSLHLDTIALWSFTSTTLYAIRFLRSDENIIFPAVMPSVRMLIPQDKRVIWHMIAKRLSSWLLILKSAEHSKKKIAGCVWSEATKISFFRLWCQTCGYWSRRISVFYDTWLQKDATVGFLFRRARNKAKSKLLSALDNRRWNKTQTKLEIDNLQSQKEYWI